jgi:hypothetical protein
MSGTGTKILRRLLVIAVVLTAVGFLFMRSLEDARSDPYSVAPAHVQSWTLELTPSGDPNGPLLSLRTGPELVSNLSRQVFRRVMESIATPQTALIPVVLQGEFDRALRGKMTAEGILAAARAAGLERASHQPLCLAHRRESRGRSVQQVYFAIVDSPAIRDFRARLTDTGGAAFDASALSPVVIVANSESSFERWLPIRADEDDCVAPIRLD